MRALVFIEVQGAAPTQASLGVLSHAAELADDAAAVVIGPGARAMAEAASMHGATRVHVADSPELSAPLPQPRVDVIASIVREFAYDSVLLAASGLSCDIAGGLAHRLDAGVNWDLIDLELQDGTLIGKRLALQDSVLVDVGWREEPRIAIFRPGAFKPVERPTEASVVEASVPLAQWSLLTKIVDQTHEVIDVPSIEHASILVSGGRGVGGPAGFEVLQGLASELGGVVSASLPTVEIGWYGWDGLVGQSGKTVQPKLYLACGISGAIQHKMGMQNSGTIVAINKDPDAPIFGFCDVAVVGDLFEIVPHLTELLRDRRGDHDGEAT